MSKKLEFLLEATDFADLPGSIGWVDNVTPLNDFFSWMDNCISERNCISVGELRMHEVLADDGKLFDEDGDLADLADEFNSEFPGNLRAYPAQDDLETLGKIWEAKERQLYHLNNYARVVKENTVHAAFNPVLQRVSALYDAEVNRVHALTASDYKKTLNGLASSFDKLLENLKYVQENGHAPSSVFSNDLDTFCELMKLLKTYVKDYVTLSKLEGGKTEFRKSLRDRFSSDAELKSIFNESVTACMLVVKKQAELDGVLAVIKLLDSGDVLSAINIKKNCVKPSDDDLAAKCYENEKLFVRLNQMKMIELALARRREILPELRQNRDKAKILKLCEEAAIFFAQQERKWVKMSLMLVSDCHGAIEDILNPTVQCHKGFSNLQTTLELSVLSPEQSFLSLHGHSTPNILKMCNDISVTNQPSRLSRVLDDFIKKSGKRLVFGKVLYNHIFDGPCAVMSTEDDAVAKIVHAKERLNAVLEDVKALEYRHYNIKVSRFNNPSNRIKDWLGFAYITNWREDDALEKKIEEEISNLVLEHRNHVGELDSSHENSVVEF